MAEEKEFAKFWDRVGAYLLDLIIIGGLTFAINYVNINNIKSFYLYLSFAVLGILYKPVMESSYGATLGKMAMNLEVTNHEYGRINFERSVLRSLILILPALFYIPIHYVAFNDSSILSAASIMEFSSMMAFKYPLFSWIANLAGILGIADIIVLLVDNGKQNRSLKDLIAKTYVIKIQNWNRL